MKFFANRASSLLCDFLQSINPKRPFLLPANVCPVVPLTFLKAGVEFVFVDIDDTHAMNKSACIDHLSSGKYQGVLFVHAYGKEFDNNDFYSTIKSLGNDLYIIDDKCLCIPDTNNETPHNVDFQLFSTGYAKYVELAFGGFANIDGCGKTFARGEYLYDRDIEAQQKVYIKKCLQEGECYKWASDVPWLDGSKLNMSGREYLELVEKKKLEVKVQKEAINAIYRNNIPKEVQMGKEYENWRFCIIVNNQRALLEEIFRNNLFAGVNFPSVSYMFSGIHSAKAELESKRIINLFNDYRMNSEQAYAICEIVKKYYE